MPTQQEMHILTLIGGMKEAVKRSADASDSEESVQQITNRSNKLKKKAKFVHEGQLGLPNGPQVYKKTIEYNDYGREIITERPPLYDDDGYEIESDDDEKGEALAAANEFYPYNDVKIEELLAPLTSVGDLPDHPSLSRAFTSKTLTELTAHARLMAQREKKSLWRMKHLLTKLSGDHTWIPTSMLETPADLGYFGDGKAEYRAYLQQKSQAQQISDAEDAEAEDEAQDDIEMVDHDMAAEDGNPLPDPVVETVERELNRFTPAATPPQAIAPLAPPSIEVDSNDAEMGEPGPPVAEQIPPTEAQDMSASSVNGHAETAEPTATESKPMNEATGQHTEQPSSNPEQASATPESIAKANEHQVATPTDTDKAVEPPAEAEITEEHDPDTTLLDPEIVDEAPHSPRLNKETSKAGDDTIIEEDKAEEKDKEVEKDRDEKPEEDAEADTEAPEPRRMRTRAQAQAVADDSAPSRQRSLSAASNESFVHPYFLPPVTSIPERDFMLPAQEAEETRKLLQLYIQKQEEIIRGSQKLYMGLLTADRMRASVMSWARAERHVGEMSDGEDWVDQQEWNLDDGLKKGHDEEEEEPAQTSKKTRTRRQ